MFIFISFLIKTTMLKIFIFYKKRIFKKSSSLA
jgi:hypothetical protein